MKHRQLALTACATLVIGALASDLTAADRTSATEKGSVLFFPKVELRWDMCGNLVQDTYLQLTNDYPGDVHVQMYFINGDPPLPAVVPPPMPRADDEQIEEAIAAGLAWLADQQSPDGSWVDGEPVGSTGLALLKFEDRARELGFDDPMDPEYDYYNEVTGGLDFLMEHVHEIDISAEPQADGDGDGIGVVINTAPGTHDVYNTAIAMMAIAASQRPDLYEDVLQDALDWMCFAQNNPDCDLHSGGWRYNANPCSTSDNSTTGYATLALGYAAAPPPIGFGLDVPAFVLERLDPWIDEIQDPVDGDAQDGGSHYTPPLGGWVNILKTGNLLYELALVGDGIGSDRVEAALAYLERHWDGPGGCDIGWVNHRQAMFTMMKGLEAYQIELLDLDDDGEIDDDWFDEVSTHLVETQNPDGSWPVDCWGGQILSTAWAMLTLERTIAPPAPPPSERPHPGWNWVDNTIMLTSNQTTYWSVLTGDPGGVSPFYVLDPAGPDELPGRPDPDGTSDRVLRGYVIAFAVNNIGEEIRWNHLAGTGTLVDYRAGAAWEYGTFALQAVNPVVGHGEQTGDPGELGLDGFEFAPLFDLLLMNFQAVGSGAYSGPNQLVSDTDLTLLPPAADLRQESAGPITTKAHIEVWNENELKLSGSYRCVTCWDQTLLSNYGVPNNFVLDVLQTDFGKARIDGVASMLCDDPFADPPIVSIDAALLGVVATLLTVDGEPSAAAGTDLFGMGFEEAEVLFDTLEIPPETPEGDDLIDPREEAEEEGMDLPPQ